MMKRANNHERKTDLLMRNLAVAVYEKRCKEIEDLNEFVGESLDFGKIKGKIEKKLMPKKLFRRTKLMLVAIMVLLISACFVIGEPVHNLLQVIQKDEEHVEILRQQIINQDEIKARLPGWENFYCISAIPTSFGIDVAFCQKLRDHTVITFTNSSGDSIVYVTYGNYSSKTYDSRVTFEDVYINEDLGVYTRKDNEEQSVLWVIGKAHHLIYTQMGITKEDLIDMAESVIFIQ